MSIDDRIRRLENEVNRLSADLDVTKQSYIHACESISNKDQMIADRDAEIEKLQADIELLNEEAETLVGSEAMSLSRVIESMEKRRRAAAIAIEWWKKRDEVRAAALADESRFKFLAGCGSSCGPVIEGFGNVLDNYWNFLGNAIRERIGEENDTPDEKGTDEDRLKAIRALIDETMKNEKVVRS